MIRMMVVLLAAMFLVPGCVPKGKYEELQTLYFDERDQHRHANRALADERRESERLQADLADAENRLQALEESLVDLRAARDQDISDLESKVRQAQESGSAAAAELSAELEAARKERAKQIAALEEQLAHAREEARQKAAELDRINRTYDDLVSNLRDEIQEGEVTISRLKGYLTVNLIDRILFESGSAELNPDGERVLKKVSEVLKDMQDREIRVEGHTDNVPIARAARSRFPSNWELSAARASTVVRFLIEHDVPAEKLAATGYAYYRPVADNDTPENRRLNRRIEIILTPLAPRTLREGIEETPAVIPPPEETL